jgi:hypothetical protein
MAGVARQPGLPRSGEKQSNSHIVALLSLKILLLAFFILLNALSTFEEQRRAAVVDSVREAFRGIVPAEYSASSTPAGSDVFEGAENTYAALKQLFSTNLELVEDRNASGAFTLQVDLAVADLFVDEGVALLPEGDEVLRIVAGVLGEQRRAGAGYQIDILYGIDAGGRDSGAAVLRAGALVRQLESLGLAPGHLSTGLMPGLRDRVRLHFTIEAETAPSAAEGTRP